MSPTAEITTRTDHLQLIAVLAARRPDPSPLTVMAVRDLLAARGLTCTQGEIFAFCNTVIAGELVAARAEQLRELIRSRPMDVRD